MVSPLFQALRILDERKLHFSIIRNSDASIAIFVTTVGKRIEIYVNEDEEISFSIFAGNENVISGQAALVRELDSD
jgi:hypothetical protein